jgi:hypothetical protein
MRPKPIPGHNLPLAAAGVLILWLGWFGFNGGSVLSAEPGVTSLVLVTTSLAAAAGGISCFLFSTFRYKNYDITMFLNGILGGLVGITAGADQMSPNDAVIIGLLAGIIIVFGVALVDRLKLDDPVGAIAVHLICGIWGTLAVGIFGKMAGWNQLLIQLQGVAIVGAFCITTAFLILYVIKITSGLRVSELVELNVGDINYEDKSVKFYGKGNKERYVPLHSDTLKAIKEYLPVRNKIETNNKDSENALFLSTRGNRISPRSIQLFVKKYAKMAGIKNASKITPHKLRHTFATILYHNTKDIKVLQDLLGHENISTTQIYTHTDQKQKKEAIDELPEL